MLHCVQHDNDRFKDLAVKLGNLVAIRWFYWIVLYFSPLGKVQRIINKMV